MRHHHLTSDGVIGHDGHTHAGSAGLILEPNEEIPWVLHYHLVDGELVEHGGHAHPDAPAVLLFYEGDHGLVITNERRVVDERTPAPALQTALDESGQEDIE